MIAFNLKLDTQRAESVIEGIKNNVIAEVMEKLASDLRLEVEGLSPVGRDNERPEGQRPMKASWSGVFGDPKGNFLAFENEQDHASIVEFGLYPKHWTGGTRTAIHTDGNRYSTQAMGGVLQPLLEAGYKGMTIEDQAQFIMDELINELIG